VCREVSDFVRSRLWGVEDGDSLQGSGGAEAMQGDLQMTASIVVVGDVAACWPLEPWPKALMELKWHEHSAECDAP